MSVKAYVKSRRRRSPVVGALVTILWVTPVMVLAALLGFGLAYAFLGPKYLTGKAPRQTSHPVRINSPEEAAKLGKDEPSHVWTEGVNPSDIPEWKPEPERRTSSSTRRRKRATTTNATTTPKVETPAAPAPSAPAPTPAPAAGGQE